MAVNIVTKDALSANIHFFVRAVLIPRSTLLQRLLCPSNAVNIVVKAAVSANRHSLSGHSQYHCQHRYKGFCLPIVFTVNIVAKAAVRQLLSLSILLQRLLSANCYHCQNCCKDCGRQLESYQYCGKDCCPPIVITVKIVAKTAAANCYHCQYCGKGCCLPSSLLCLCLFPYRRGLDRQSGPSIHTYLGDVGLHMLFYCVTGGAEALSGHPPAV